jgi:hypothetical protein
MEELEKKLKRLKELLEKGMQNAGIGGPGSVKAGMVLPSISKLPKPGHTSVAGKVKIPNATPATKKNPIKSAEQTHNKDIKDIKMKEAHAQLKIKPMEKEEKSQDLYHIHQNGMKITSTPMSLKDIHEKHGGVQKLENAGFKVMPHKPEQISFKKNGQWELEDLNKSESPPAHDGTYHGQVHERVTERGERTVRFPKQKPDGSTEFGVRKIPNKVKVVHAWDHDKKKWNHKETTNLVNSHVDHGHSQAKTPMDIAHEKANVKSEPKVESKVKTIRRKLDDVKKTLE